MAIPQRPARTIAPGSVEAARAHVAATGERAQLVDRPIKNVMQRLDALVEQLAGPEPGPGQQAEQRDPAILRARGHSNGRALRTVADRSSASPASY